MTIQLPTTPAFLRHNLLTVRGTLLGLDKAQVSARYHSVGKIRMNLRFPTLSGRITNVVLTAIIVVSVMVMGVLTLPSFYYFVRGVETQSIQATQTASPLGGEFNSGTLAVQPAPSASPYIPSQDTSLPEGRWIIIPRIGVRTELRETGNPDEALNQGVWMVPGYGSPGDRTKPMILAAHRYGWQWWWKTDYWKYNSFYLLPDLEPGDQVEVIADQRKWIYEIYAGEEGEQITDYQADLIMYTCKFLQSPVRHFRYARLIDPTKNTQTSAR